MDTAAAEPSTAFGALYLIPAETLVSRFNVTRYHGFVKVFDTLRVMELSWLLTNETL